jgi:hypothetical protein
VFGEGFLVAASECVEAIKKAFKGKRKFTDDDVEFIVDELQKRMGGRQKSLDMPDKEWRKVATQLARDIQAAAHVERRNRKLNIKVKARLLSMANEAAERHGDAALGLEAALVGINKRLRGGRNSADLRGGALTTEYLGGLLADLEQADLLVHLNSGHLDLEIARALEKITKPDALGSSVGAANQIAEIIHRYRKLAFDRQNRAGAWAKPLAGYITRQSHDMTRLVRAGFDNWREFITPLLDPRTFDGHDDVNLFFREVYDTLASGEAHRATGGDSDLSLAFTGPGNLAKRLSSHRTLHFRNADAWHNYNQKFGFKNLRESIAGDLEHMARNTGLMEVMGTNPRAMFDQVLKELRQKHRGKPKVIERLNAQKLKMFMDTVDGTTRIPQNMSLASFGNSARLVQATSKLGGAIISSITDVPNKAVEIRRVTGADPFTALVQSLTTFVDTFAGKDKRITAELLGIGIDGMIGDVGTRFQVQDSLMPSGSKLMRWFFKLNLLSWWTDANKRGLGLMIGRYMAMHSDKAFDKLPGDLRFAFESLGIEPQHWDVLRKATGEAPDGRTYILPEKIEGADKSNIETLYRAFLLDVAESGIPTPGARERAFLTAGAQSGTVLGEAVRFITQFKAFPLTVITKPVGRMIYSNADGKADLVGLASYIAGTTLLGYAAMAAKDLAKGRTPREVTVASIMAAMAQGGGAGIFGDFFLGETNRYGRSLIDTLSGPTLGTISDLDEMRARIFAGDDVLATALRVATQNAPFGNLFYTKLALDYLVLFQLQEAVNPGYLRRAEKRLKREQNQTYIIGPPSKAVPRGGGDRIAEGLR